MRQTTFSEEAFEKHHKKTRREQFLEDMDQIVFWQERAAAIAPHYPQPKGWPPADWCRGHAAHSSPAALVHLSMPR